LREESRLGVLEHKLLDGLFVLEREEEEEEEEEVIQRMETVA
jgi:hypothetical protein